MKKICVIGHFGKGKNLLNGQTIKTKIFTNQLAVIYGEDEIVRIDTHGGLKNVPKLIVQSIIAVAKCKNIVIFPSDNGLKLLVPLLTFENFFFRRRLHYIVIGGYLHEYLRDYPKITRWLKKFSGIYVETKPMKDVFEKDGFKNVSVVPNCKEISVISKDQLKYHTDGTFDFCTFSRVMKSKGIEDAVDAIEKINREHGKTICTLTVYGQVDKNETEWFNRLQIRMKTIDGITYGGLVPFDKSVAVLQKYHGLLFPTFYEGEGFAGTLIDAFASGVPVIASDWHFNSSIVEDGITGYIYPNREQEQFVSSIKKSIKDVKSWNDMKENCIQKAESLKPENVINLITKHIL